MPDRGHALPDDQRGSEGFVQSENKWTIVDCFRRQVALGSSAKRIWTVDEGPSPNAPLLLASRQRGRGVIQTVCETHLP